MDRPGLRFFESGGYRALLFDRTTWGRRESERNSEASRCRRNDFQRNCFLNVCQGAQVKERKPCRPAAAQFQEPRIENVSNRGRGIVMRRACRGWSNVI